MAADQTTTTPPGSPVQPAGDKISVEEFMRVELRAARVVAAERVPNTRKLIKLEVDLGSERRTLVAGLADVYEPESLVGRSVVVVANLKPARVMGIDSDGMILAASPDGGKPVVVTFDAPPPPGSRVR